MTRKEIEPFLPKWRIGAISLKEFHSLRKEQKDEYVKNLINIPENERGDVDIHILRFHSIDIKPDTRNFFSIEDIY